MTQIMESIPEDAWQEFITKSQEQDNYDAYLNKLERYAEKINLYPVMDIAQEHGQDFDDAITCFTQYLYSIYMEKLP